MCNSAVQSSSTSQAFIESDKKWFMSLLKAKTTPKNVPQPEYDFYTLHRPCIPVSSSKQVGLSSGCKQQVCEMMDLKLTCSNNNVTVGEKRVDR